MGFWRRENDLERELRAARPELRRELVDGIARMIGREPAQRSGRRLRVGVAVGLSAAMLGVLGAFGGLSYAANGITNAVAAAVHVVAPAKPAKLTPAPAVSSAMAQYKVEMCFHGNTLSVDSHAVPALTKNGAKVGPCSGKALKKGEKLVVVCFKGQNVTIAKSSANTAKKQKALKKLGLKLGFCKKA